MKSRGIIKSRCLRCETPVERSLDPMSEFICSKCGLRWVDTNGNVLYSFNYGMKYDISPDGCLFVAGEVEA